MAGKKLDSVKYTNMFKAYGAFWRRGFTEWAGTASRSEYWWNVLMNALIGLAASLVYSFFGALGLAAGSVGVVIFGGIVVFVPLVIYCLAVLVPWISLTVRRLHDAGLSSWSFYHRLLWRRRVHFHVRHWALLVSCISSRSALVLHFLCFLCCRPRLMEIHIISLIANKKSAIWRIFYLPQYLPIT